VGTFVDAAILSTLADGTVIVVRPNLATRAELVEACEQLQKADANILGICATFCEGTDSEYYYAYYTNDGERVKRGDDAGATQGRTAADRLERIQGISRSSAEAERLRASLNGASRAASSRFRSRGDR